LVLTIATSSRPTEEIPDAGHYVLDDGCIERVEDLLTVSSAADEIGFLEHGEVVRNRGLGQVKVRGELPRGHFSTRQKSEDFAARGVGKGLEDLIHDNPGGYSRSAAGYFDDYRIISGEDAGSRAALGLPRKSHGFLTHG
jgi:hypothetical protein